MQKPIVVGTLGGGGKLEEGGFGGIEEESPLLSLAAEHLNSFNFVNKVFIS